MTSVIILVAVNAEANGEQRAFSNIAGEPAVERIIKAAGQADIGRIILVTGYRRERFRSLIDKYGLTEVYDPGYSRGPASYMKAATDALTSDEDGFFILPPSAAAVKSDIIDFILERRDQIEEQYDRKGKAMIFPCYYGKPGYPVYLPVSYKDEAAVIVGDPGFRHITADNIENVFYIETQSESVVMSTATEKGYRQVCHYCESGSVDENIYDLAKGHRFILIRHALVERPEEKVFFGQSDFRLSEEGIIQATKVAYAMQHGQYRTEHIYSSNLSRAADTAEIIREMSPVFRSVIYDRAFREISRGPWDSKLVSSVKEKYPNEFKQREENLFKFRFNDTCENYFDVEYRVLSAVKRILKNDPYMDFILVSHEAVMRVIETVLKHRDINAEWTSPLPCEVREFTL